MATARGRSFSVSINFEPLVPLADKIDRLSSNALLRLSAVDAANEVAVRFDQTARRAMNAGLNLSDSYIADRMRVVPATPGAAGPVRADIIARGDLTILGRYPNAQLTQPAPRAKGDPKRGIAPGRKQAGVAAEIRRGAAVAEERWFTMTLRAGTQAGDKVGVFYRDSSDRVTHKYGPSPYSLFRFQVEARQDDLAEDLRNTAAAAAAETVRKALS